MKLRPTVNYSKEDIILFRARGQSRDCVTDRCFITPLFSGRKKDKDEGSRGSRYSRSERRCWCRCAQIYRFPESWRRGCWRQSNWFFCPLLPRRSEFYSLAWSFSFDTPPTNTPVTVLRPSLPKKFNQQSAGTCSRWNIESYGNQSLPRILRIENEG